MARKSNSMSCATKILESTMPPPSKKPYGTWLPSKASSSSDPLLRALCVKAFSGPPVAAQLSTFNRTDGLHLPFNLGIFARPSRHFQIVKILQVQPELRVRLEVACQPQRRLRRHPPPLVYDFSDPRRWHMQLQCQLVHRQAQRLHEILP